MANSISNKSNISQNGSVLGIDVGYSLTSHTTCFCLLSWDQNSINIDCRNTTADTASREQTLGDMVPNDTLISSVAIDGPLAHDLQIVNHYRAAEALLTLGVFRRRGKPGQTNSPVGLQLHDHATRLAQLVLSKLKEGCFSLSDSAHYEPIHEKCIVEAFPNQFLAALINDREFAGLVLNRDASDRY